MVYSALIPTRIQQHSDFIHLELAIQFDFGFVPRLDFLPLIIINHLAFREHLTGMRAGAFPHSHIAKDFRYSHLRNHIYVTHRRPSD